MTITATILEYLPGVVSVSGAVGLVRAAHALDFDRGGKIAMLVGIVVMTITTDMMLRGIGALAFASGLLMWRGSGGGRGTGRKVRAFVQQALASLRPATA